MPTAAVLVTGSEILLGRTQDTNSGFLARVLDARGVRLKRVVTVDDDFDGLVAALRELIASEHELILTSGGLGPTHDDRTVEAVAAALGRPLVVDAATEAAIGAITAEFARNRGVEPSAFSRGNRKQATMPEGATVLPPVGTAPGLIVELGERRIVVLPGPPVELQRMWEDAVARPLLAGLFGSAAPRRLLRIFGVPESQVADAFTQLGGDSGGTETTICASRMEIELVIRDAPQLPGAASRLADGIKARFGAAVYAEDDRRLEEHVVDLLRAQGLTLATAESCTAGLVAARVADVPGCSDVLVGGIVAYANGLKERGLGVPAALIAAHGAVSAEVARAMADGARARTGADVAVAVTGVAGPGGGTAEKPVGLVHLHAVGPLGRAVREIRLPGRRADVRAWSTTLALHLVRRIASGDVDPV